MSHKKVPTMHDRFCTGMLCSVGINYYLCSPTGSEPVFSCKYMVSTFCFFYINFYLHFDPESVTPKFHKSLVSFTLHFLMF